MLVKLGVDVSRLCRPIRRRLATIDGVFSLLGGSEAVVTSTYEGDHQANSLHYSNEAIDIRLPAASVGKVVERLKETLGPDFDVLLEVSHVHIEYDPKVLIV